MTKGPLRAFLLLGALALAPLPACDVNSPERFIRAPIIKDFAPSASNLDVFVGETLTFSITALDPDDRTLAYHFTLGDSVVTNEPVWTYVVHDTGMVEVMAHVSNERSESIIRWRLLRTQPENEPPTIVHVEPPDPSPRVIVGNLIEFTMTAVDPEGQPLSYIFTVDDSLVWGGNRYVHEATEVGVFGIRSIVSDGERFASHEWTLTVMAEPDSIPPATVMIRSLETGLETGELLVEWTAVGDDSMEGLPTHYVLRTSPAPVVDEVSWSRGSDRPGEPPPAAPGEVQAMVVRDLNPANLVYVAVRAVDDFGNLSPLGNTRVAMVKGNDLSGTIRDALTGDPLAGMRIQLVGMADTTGADGRFVWDALPDGTGAIRVWDEDDPADYGAYFDINTGPELYRIVDEDVLDIWMIPNVTLDTPAYPSFLEFIKSMVDNGGAYSQLIRTWDTPVDVYVPAWVHNGLDYEQVIKESLVEWETLVGFDLFRFVEAVPQRGFYFEYNGSIQRDVYEMLQWDSRRLPILSRITMRTFYDSTTVRTFHTIAAHEAGHALGLSHSVDQGHLMVGFRAAAVSRPTRDEIWLVRVLYRLPRGQSVDWYRLD